MWQQDAKEILQPQTPSNQSTVTSGSEWTPPSQDDDQRGKRAREQTPMEKEQRGGTTVNHYNSAVQLKRRKVEPERASGNAIARRRAEQSLEDAWDELRARWEAATNVEFPALNAGLKIWAKAVTKEELRVLPLLRSTQVPSWC